MEKKMEIKNLYEPQLKTIFCAAMGWMNVDIIKKAEERYGGIQVKWDEDRWVVKNSMVQIELTEQVKFRCGLGANWLNDGNCGSGGMVFDIMAVAACLISFGIV